VQYASDRYGDRHFDTKIRAGTRCIYESVLVLSASQLLPFLVLLYAEVHGRVRYSLIRCQTEHISVFACYSVKYGGNGPN